MSKSSTRTPRVTGARGRPKARRIPGKRNVEQLAEATGLTTYTVRKHFRQERLHGEQVGGVWYADYEPHARNYIAEWVE